MITLGMMTLNQNSEHTYFTEIARRSKPFNIECCRFSPAHIHPVSQMASGERFDHEKDAWVKDEFTVPGILYDRCFYSEDFSSKQSMAVVKWLRNRKDVMFLGNGLPNKLAIHELLAQSALSPYIPLTKAASSGKAAVRQLKEWRKLILKPAFGSGGAGIYSLELGSQAFVIRKDDGEKIIEKRFYSESETEAWLDQLFRQREYLLQRFFELSDSQGCPFDIRFLLQKDREGNWVTRGRALRRGHKGGILSNLNAGGEVVQFEDYVESLDKKTKQYILGEMKEILSQLPETLETAFPPLFELGIDIGVSKDNALWILDTNSKPGRKIVLQTDPDSKEALYKAPLEYALFLANRRTEREEQTI